MKADIVADFCILYFTSVGLVHAAKTTGHGLFSSVEDPTIKNSTEYKLNLGVTPISPYGDIQSHNPWASPLVEGCPKLCSTAGPNPSNWTFLHSRHDLIRCDAPLLFDFNVQSSAIDTFRTCAIAAPSQLTKDKRSLEETSSRRGQFARRQEDSANQEADLETIAADIASSGSCGASTFTLKTALSTGPAGVLSSRADAAVAVEALSSHLSATSTCGRSILFAKAESAIVGLYISADVLTSTAATLTLKAFKSQVQQGSQVMQACDANTLNPYTLGLFAVDGINDLERAQVAVAGWANGRCVSDSAGTSKSIMDLSVLGSDAPIGSNSTTRRSLASLRTSRVDPRAAACTAIEVTVADSCASLSARCGIRGADFLKYNPQTNLCNNLMEKQWVCCSEGSLPPLPQEDGTCNTYTVGPGDGCWAIGDNFGINQTLIEEYNENTWGWAGCDRLQIDQVICLSKGNTPMPAQIDGVACGPQKPGTTKPQGDFDGWDLAELNPCPLNACCSGWGYCGTTTEFCTESPADTGAPGAFKEKTNGCISNCGTDIVNNDNPPEQFKRVGYFQGYNGGRSCLRMDSSEIKDEFSDLTHVHFAFAGLTEDLDVNIGDNVKEQFDKFEAMDAPFKKVISFGGWAESTEAATYQRYRDAVKPANRERFATNVVKFLDDHPGLDGVDFDWEYPGAVDQGIPASNAEDTVFYLRFLSIMRDKLDGGRSLSIALPASFWYLKPFPVDQMSEVVDYFIYMTYDLHGQWDFGNAYANPGCNNGNCLRSHVNITETENALSMITKAGVPAEKIIVGISSYGRSFRMADSSCTGPECLFTGSYSVSEAEPGICTQTGGYISNAELSEILDYADAGEPGYEAKKWYDKKTDSDMMTYGTQGNGMTDWVAYMSDDTKKSRVDWIKGLNFGGTTDWAIDLSGWFKGSLDTEGGWGLEADNLDCESGDWPDTLEKLESDVGSVPAQCRGMALMKILNKDLAAAIEEYKEVSKDYEDKFGWYADWVKDSINDRMEEFMKLLVGEGLKYMDCKWESRGNSGEGPCTEANPTWAPGPNPGPRVVEFTMRDEEGYYAALLESTGIKREWLDWVDEHALVDPCPPCPGLPPCPGQATCAQNYYMRRNWPRRIEDKSKIDIDNPKEIVDEAIPSTEELVAIAAGTYGAMRSDTFDAEDADIVTSFSMPIFMMQDASKSIKEIKEIGEEMKETHTRELVLNILTIIFAVIPFAGQAMTALGGAARIASAALIIGEAGNAAISIVDIVKNPDSAPFAILGMLIGAAGLKGGKPPRGAFKDAADARRALSANDMKAFSDEFRRKDGLVQNVIKSCTIR